MASQKVTRWRKHSPFCRLNLVPTTSTTSPLIRQLGGLLRVTSTVQPINSEAMAVYMRTMCSRVGGVVVRYLPCRRTAKVAYEAWLSLRLKVFLASSSSSSSSSSSRLLRKSCSSFLVRKLRWRLSQSRGRFIDKQQTKSKNKQSKQGRERATLQ